MQQVTDLANPDRCRASAPDGQCRNVSEYGSNYCRHHGGESLEPAEDRRGFLLAKADDRVRLAKLSDEMEPVKELRDVIALQHMLIERRYNMVKNDNDLLAACGPLNQMIASMEKLISSANKIEQNLGELLARNAVLGLAKSMCQIVIDELEGVDDYEIIIDRITQRLVDTVRQADNRVQTRVVVPDLPALESDL